MSSEVLTLEQIIEAMKKRKNDTSISSKSFKDTVIKIWLRWVEEYAHEFHHALGINVLTIKLKGTLLINVSIALILC